MHHDAVSPTVNATTRRDLARPGCQLCIITLLLTLSARVATQPSGDRSSLS
jgi:hypothetical protein